MIISALLGIAMIPRSAEARIVATSMFKNGYAVVMREIDIPSAGDYDIGAIPQGSMGTLWFAASDGASLDSVETTNQLSKFESPVGQLAAILAANVNHQVRLGMKEGDAVTGNEATGKLVSVGDDMVILQTDKGMLVIPKATITSIASAQGDLKYTVEGYAPQRVLRLHVSGRAGKVSMVSLEHGLTWSPAYAFDVSDKKKLSIVAKSTVLDDLEDLKDVDVRFVTGFPNVPFMGYVDPLVAGQAIDQMLGASAGAPGGAGGFGGGAGRFAGQSMAKNVQGLMMAPGANTPSSTLAGEQLEDLFFYHQGNVTLKRGDRAYYILFKAETPYKDIYTWDTENPIVNNVEYRAPNQEAAPDEVWHALAFKNSSGRPFTTGPATTFQNGQILGQDTLDYVPPGADAELKITKALDVQAESSEEEVTRVRGAIKAFNRPVFDLVTLKSTLQATNLKKEDVTVRIRRDFTGEIVSADGDPVIKKTAKGLRSTNPSGRLTWTKTVAPGQKLTLTFTYNVYVRSE